MAEKKSGKPLHIVAEEAVKKMIAEPEYRNGKLLPNEIDLAESLGVSRNTLRQAINKLVFEGYLCRKKGYGTWVVRKTVTSGVKNWMSFLWNVAAGNCTAVALAYESDDAEPVLYLKRFTCDPAGIYAPKVNEFDWFNDESNPNYSPFSTLFWTMQASNVSSIKYLCMRTDYLDYMISNLKTSAAELAWERGNEVNEETVAKVNSEEGLATLFNTLKQGLSYTICICLSNEFGDTVFVQKTASTKGYSAADFDKNVTLDDFLGAFKASAVVDQASGSSSEEESFRVDIYSLGGNDVVINGLSNTRDFTPGVKGWYACYCALNHHS